MQDPEVVVVGTVAYDTVVQVDRLPEPDETARIRHRADRPGGAAGNVAMGLGRMGLHPILLATVGPDFPGSDYEKALSSTGVDLDHLAVVDAPTSHVYLFTDAQDRQQIYSYPGAAARLDELTVPDDLLDDHATGHFAAGALAAYPELMVRLGRVTFDPGQELFQRSVTEFEACLPHVDVLFLNEHEKKHLDRITEDDRTGRSDAGDWPSTLVVSRGAQGSTLIEGRNRCDIPAVAARMQDPSGAGDAQCAGFLFGLVHELPLEQCARLGAVVAAFAVEALGTQDGLPTLEDVRTRYEDVWGAWPL